MSIKQKIEKQLIECYSLENNENSIYHPIRFIQASKSLIGINTLEPNEILINWSANYINQFKVKPNLEPEIPNVEYFASMINLEILLNEKKFDKSKDEILRLLQVSTGEPILEILIIHSIKDLVQLPTILSIYRSVKFCNGIDVKNAILLALELLKSNEISIKDLSKTQLIDIFTSIIEIKNTEFIRNEEIINKLNLIDLSIFHELNLIKIKSEFTKKLIEKGRGVLLDIINENEKILTKKENILILDSIRIILRYRNSNENDNLLNYASSFIESKND